MPAGLNDRAEDNWRGLLTIADQIGGSWPEQARTAAVKLQHERRIEDEGNASVLLLGDIFEIWEGDDRPRLPSAYLIEILNTMEHRPWPEWGRLGTPMTATRLAKLLSPFGIRPKTIRLGPGEGPGILPKGYERTQFDDAFERYLSVPSTATPQRVENHCENRPTGFAVSSAPPMPQHQENINEYKAVAATRVR